MSDPAVSRWKQQGRVFLWRYVENTRNYPGWHLTADAVGARSLLELTSLMRAASWPSRTTIDLTRPTEAILKVPNNRDGEARWVGATRLCIRSAPELSPTHWDIRQVDDTVELRPGSEMLAQLDRGLHDILDGRGDYSMGGPPAELWFWRFPSP